MGKQKKVKPEKPKLYVASCSFGKDSIATILLALEHNEPLDRVVFAEVMFDHEKGISGEIPEHIEWIYKTAIPRLEQMGVKVDVVRSEKDYKGMAYRERKDGSYYGLKYAMPCFANYHLKVHPIKKYLANFKKEYELIEYIGIASDEPIRLERIKNTNKISLLDKYGVTEKMALDKCKQHNLISPLYSSSSRGGVLVLS
jgi:3'-phosphoadenosine 5'-phosphosulfate sulfotransferase (PAPS reductase)/FAD synthetase